MELPKVIDYCDFWISKAAAFNAPVWLMNEKSVLPFPMPNAKTIKLKHNKEDFEYYLLYSGFDIETTNYDQNEKHLGFMYHWQFSLASDSSAMLFTGRTWDSYVHFIGLLTDFYNLSREKRIICFDANLGFELVATPGTADSTGLDTVEKVKKVSQGSPNIRDAILNNEIDLIIKTSEGKQSAKDGYIIRRLAIELGIPYVTTLAGARAALNAIAAVQNSEINVKSLNEYVDGE